MAGLLTDDGSGWDIDPSLLSLMAQSATAPDPSVMASMAAAPPAPDASSVVAPAPADSGTGFWGGLANATGNVGLALGGGLDPSITGDARSMAGQRALLSFGLNMLANSGPSYTPRNFGQILATGLQGAAESNLTTEQNRVKAQQVGATLALKAGQLRIQELLAGITGAKAAKELGVASKVSNAAAAPAAGDTVAPIAAPASAADFVTSNAPLFQDVAARTGLPVDFVAGQAGNESQWGTSPAAVQGNNLFGIMDGDKPAHYATKQAGVDAYVALLNGKYAGVPRTGSATDIGTALGRAGYNTVVPDYGTRMGNFAAQAAPLLPQPTTGAPTGAATPGTMVAGPGAGSGAPSGGAAAPAPSSTPPSPGVGVVGPAAAPVPATVGQPAAPTWGPGSPGWVTLPEPDFSDLTARRGAVESTYQAERSNVANSGDPTLQSKANQDRLNSLAAIDKEVADRKAAYAKDTAELNQRRVAEEAKIAGENQRNQATIAAELARNQATIQAKAQEDALQRQHERDLENIKAGVTYHQKIAEQSAMYAQENTLKPMADQAFKAHDMNLGLAQLLPVLADLPKGGTPMAAFLQQHQELAPLLGPNGANILDSKQVDAVRLIDGLVSNISTQMKPTGLGALREYEWNGFKSQLPNLMSSPEGQQKAVSLLMNMNNRVASENGWMQQYFNRQVPDQMATKPGATVPAHNLDMETDPAHPNESIQQRMDRELGPVVPSYTGPLTGTAQAQWEQSLAPGKPYYKAWAVPDPAKPGQPKRDSNGNVVTTKTLEFRPW